MCGLWVHLAALVGTHGPPAGLLKWEGPLVREHDLFFMSGCVQS